MSYPKWKYHESEMPKLIHDQTEELELGDDWGEAPVEAPPALDSDAGEATPTPAKKAAAKKKTA